MVSQFGSLGYTIMGKTVEMTVVQKTIIDTLHKEGKPQTFIAKEAGCSQSAVSKHVNRKLSGRKKCGRKRCTTNRENRSLMRIVKQNRFKNLVELHKEWTEAGVKASRATTHRRVKKFGYSCRQRRLTWAKEKKNWAVAQWSKVLFSDESKFVFHLETKVLESGVEGDTGVNSQTSPVPLPQKFISSRPNPMKKLGENHVPSTPGRMTPIPSHSRVVFFFFSP